MQTKTLTATLLGITVKKSDIPTTAKPNKLISALGWYGVLAILTAYALVSFDVITTKGYAYQILNLSGAIGIVIETVYKKDKQPAVLNAVWATVALIAIIQLIVK